MKTLEPFDIAADLDTPVSAYIPDGISMETALLLFFLIFDIKI